MSVHTEIKLLLDHLHPSPGVYKMHNSDGDIIYVGKAKNLAKRVRSYFLKQKNRSLKVEKMVEEICNITYIEVTTELDALVLETNFIKELRPKYNILMRDDKNYQYIKITQDEDYPRVYTTRKIIQDNALYFGPKTSSSSVFHTLKLLRKIFPYRTCNLRIRDNSGQIIVENKTIKIPCIYYHIKRCLGPCIVSCKDEYSDVIEHMKSFLGGDYKEILKQLEEKMTRFAQEKKFEKAAKERDLMVSVKQLMEKQRIDQADERVLQDIIGIERRRNKSFINLFQVRNGRLVGQENFIMEDKEEDLQDTPAIIEQFILQYYSTATDFPQEIVIPESFQDNTLLEKWFKQLQHHVKILSPKRGIKTHLLDLATANAVSYAEQFQVQWQKDHAQTKGAAKELAKCLGIETELFRIECYDISHLSGTSTVGSMVVFKDGQASRKDYRRFKIKQLKEGEIDDFQSLQEVLTRRFKRIKELEILANDAHDLNREESLYEIPSLIIIDGGKGQLSSVMEIAHAMDIHIPIVSLAKQEEEIFFPNNPTSLLLPRDSQALYLVQNIRDEAHRFAITYNRALRSKKIVKSLLDEIPGVGPVIKKKLLKEFHSVEGIKEATVDSLSALIGQKLAQTIKEYI